jgi:hypothetical protein
LRCDTEVAQSSLATQRFEAVEILLVRLFFEIDQARIAVALALDLGVAQGYRHLLIVQKNVLLGDDRVLPLRLGLGS